MLIGGSGDDILYGGAGDDTFVWEEGDAGMVAAPAHDVVKDFGNGNDKLDLSDLLQGEGADDADLSDYLNVSLDGADTVIRVSTSGNLATDGSGFDQMITLEGVDLTGGVSDQNQLIDDLIAAGKLVVD